MVFETQRLLVRKLNESDLQGFHEMQSDPEVMKYVDGEPKTLKEHQEELQQLIGFYDNPNNEFIIFAVELKSMRQFIGTIALVKDEHQNDEIGYRFLQKYWGQGYGFEIVTGLIAYCKAIGKEKLVAYVTPDNQNSVRILEKSGFNIVGVEEKSRDLIFEMELQ
ncbi:MAG: GNAT family N-acetyltransferase [Flavobacteriaceae bacterium]|nr:GNAT family N-acetyltransferase [Flavobacteriaceae bacterium]|tara:strand:+ start:37297 stop:37788 length:492 start_codon:yes stop_codon:yes gene_type:complete